MSWKIHLNQSEKLLIDAPLFSIYHCKIKVFLYFFFCLSSWPVPSISSQVARWLALQCSCDVYENLYGMLFLPIRILAFLFGNFLSWCYLNWKCNGRIEFHLFFFGDDITIYTLTFNLWHNNIHLKTINCIISDWLRQDNKVVVCQCGYVHNRLYKLTN